MGGTSKVSGTSSKNTLGDAITGDENNKADAKTINMIHLVLLITKIIPFQY
jgi:hypothetical protein